MGFWCAMLLLLMMMMMMLTACDIQHCSLEALRHQHPNLRAHVRVTHQTPRNTRHTHALTL